MSDAAQDAYRGFRGRVGEFTSDSEPFWTQPPAAREGAPNVIVMLVDDLGFSDLGPFGSEIETPHIDALAENGWVFTDYRTAPLCSPARASLLTGLNPHRAGFGLVAHTDPGYPGFACALPEDAATLAESLRAGGYATLMVGKWHLTADSRLHDGADRSSWPLQRGFDRYFGSMDGFTSLHHPHRLVRDNSVVDVREFPDGYFLGDQLVDEAIAMIDDVRVNGGRQPFFLYFAHTAVHGPVQAKPVDIAKYRGRYEAGWNVLREERFARQRERGIVAPGAALPTGALADESLVPEWDTLSGEERALFARHMEVYAAAVDEVDQSVGRLRAHLEKLGESENTIIVIASDNGGTAEGGATGTRSYFSQFGRMGTDPDGWVRDVPRDIDLIGGPRMFNHYPTGWARVSNTPFRAFKGSLLEGGVHAPLILSWPAAEEERRGGLRHQSVFVSDLAPTILELTGTAPLAERAGRPTITPDGRSLAGLLGDPDGSGRTEQFFECFGARSLLQGGRKAVSTRPPTRAEGAAGGVWQLYDLDADPTETVDLAASHPDEVARMAERWRTEAWRNGAFPLDDDGSLHRVRPATERSFAEPVVVPTGRPPLERYRSAALTVLRSFTVEIDVTVGAADGVLVAHGDQGGGYLIAIDAGAPLLVYNAYGDMHRARGAELVAGARRFLLRVEELPDLRWSLTLDVDGVPAAQIPRVPMLLGMAPFTGISVGYDYGGPVDWVLYEKHRSYPFTGPLSVRYVPGARSPHDVTELREIHRDVARIAD